MIRRQSKNSQSLLLLTTLLSSLGLGPLVGCAVVEPQRGCQCGKHRAARPLRDPLLADLRQTFDKIVIGVEPQQQAVATQRPVKRKEPIHPATHVASTGDLYGPLSSLASDTNVPSPGDTEATTPELLPAAPPLESAAQTSPPANADAPIPLAGDSFAPEWCPAQQPISPMDAPVGPPPRFFPVPAKPVFSAAATQPCFR